MKTITKEVYYCEHCTKHGLSKSKMEYHEKICYSNPENIRPCYNCQHLGKKKIQICEEYYGQENFRNVDIFYCNKKQCFLYAPQNEIKGNVFDLSDEINNAMPKECENFKRKDYSLNGYY